MDRPSAFRWLVVVNWNAGRASVGDVDGVKGILELLRQSVMAGLEPDDAAETGSHSEQYDDLLPTTTIQRRRAPALPAPSQQATTQARTVQR